MSEKTLETILAENAQYAADLATAKQSIASLQGNIATLTTERDTANASLTTASTNLATVTTERDAACTENANLQTQMKDFNARVAAEVAKLGIQHKPEAASAKAGDKTISFDEQVAIAKGRKV